MRIAFFLCCFFSLTMAMGQAPTKEQIEKEFLKTLQNILEIAEQQQDPDEPHYTVDSAFAINDGILSVTLRYKNKDSSYYVERFAAPMRTLSSVFYDIYIGLEYYYDEVYIRRSRKNSDTFSQYALTRLWHLGMLPETKGLELQQKLTVLIRALRKWYH